MARGGSMVDATFIWALKLNEEQGLCARPLKHTSPRKGEPGVSDTRRISAWMPQVALCMVWRRPPRMYLTYPMAHTLVREDDRFCCADFRLYRYSEAPLRSQQIHTSHLCAKALLRKPSTIKSLNCALSAEKKHQVQEGIRPLKGRSIPSLS